MATVNRLERENGIAEQNALNASRRHSEQLSSMAEGLNNLRRTVEQLQVGSGGMNWGERWDGTIARLSACLSCS